MVSELHATLVRSKEASGGKEEVRLVRSATARITINGIGTHARTRK